MSINEVRIEGNLTRLPEVKAVGEKSVIKFGIAHNTRKKDSSGQWVDGDPGFYEVELWSDNPVFWLKRLDKGVGVIVFGELKFDSWEKEGVKHSMVKIRAESIGGKWLPEIGANAGQSAPVSNQNIDEIPF